jgi:hypothetical protein
MVRKNCLAVVVILVVSCAAYAVPITPSFSTAPAGWSVDRYAPSMFADIGAYQGLSNVLGIGITSAGALNDRPSNYQYSFYDTQGEGYAVSGGAGSTLDAELYIPVSWASSTNGDVRTDMWGALPAPSRGANDPYSYPIIGFTNYDTTNFTGGIAGTFEVYDETLNGGSGGWDYLSNPVDYGAWNSLEILFTGTSYVYSINGEAVYTQAAPSDATGFSGVLMEAYNFGGDPARLNTNPVGYTADWANEQEISSTPEPGSLLLLGTGLLGIGRLVRRKIAA